MFESEKCKDRRDTKILLLCGLLKFMNCRGSFILVTSKLCGYKREAEYGLKNEKNEQWFSLKAEGKCLCE